MSDRGSTSSDVTTSAPSSSAPDAGASSPAPASSSSDSGDSSAQSPSATDSPPPSSSETNTRQSDREGLLAAVRSVVKTSPDKPAQEASSEDEFGLDQQQDKDGVARETVAPGETKSPDQTQQVVGDDLPDPTEAELNKLRPETRKRFERLLSQRNQARRDLQALEPELQQSRQLQGYLRQNQLATDDVNTLLGVGAALRRGDYQAFLNGVTPFVMTAQEALGLRIPKDLQGQVDQGLISGEAAAEMSRTRFRAGHAEHRLNEQSQYLARQSQEQVLTQVQQAVNGWEATIRSRDPDYQTKAVAVRRFAQALLQERGAPRDVTEAVSLVQTAYDEATSELARIRPAPKPTRQVPAGSQGSTVTASRAPTTMKEAALQALAGARASR